MVHYEQVLTTLDTEQLTEVLIKAIFNIMDYRIPLLPIEDRYSLQVWSSLCYYLNVKRRLSIASTHKQTGKPKDKTAQGKPIYELTIGLSKMTGCGGSLWKSLHITIYDKQAK